MLAGTWHYNAAVCPSPSAAGEVRDHTKVHCGKQAQCEPTGSDIRGCWQGLGLGALGNCVGTVTWFQTYLVPEAEEFFLLSLTFKTGTGNI